MCDKCEIGEYQNFDSYQTHDKFDLLLTQKQSKNIIIDKGFKNSANYLVCNYCNQEFFYSPPDQAWRGFFLKSENFIPPKDTDVTDKNKKVINWVIYIILVLLVIWLLN
jgi:hypothetical protein